MKSKIALLFIGLLSISEIKSVDPITLVTTVALGSAGATYVLTVGKNMLPRVIAENTVVKELTQRIHKFANERIQKKLADSQTASKALEKCDAARERFNNLILVQKFRSYIAQKRAEVKHVSKYEQQESYVSQSTHKSSDTESWKKNKTTPLRDEPTGAKVTMTQNNLRQDSRVSVDNSGMFARTIINKPEDMREYGNAIGAQEFWKGKYKGLRNGVAGMFGVAGLSYYLMPKKEERPIVFFIEPSQSDSYYLDSDPYRSSTSRSWVRE